MRWTLLSGVAGAALLAGASSVMAATITQTVSLSALASGGSASGNGTLDLFNVNLGTLNSVLVVTQLSAYSDGAHNSVGQFEWTGGTSSTSTHAHPIATVAASITNGPSQLTGPAAVSITLDGGDVTIPGDTPVVFVADGSNGDGQSSTITSSLSDWEFAGTATDTLDLSVIASNGSGSGFSLAWPTVGPDIDYTAQITYNYTPTGGSESTPTPEPASILTLGAGLVGLGGLRRRRNRARPRPPLNE